MLRWENEPFAEMEGRRRNVVNLVTVMLSKTASYTCSPPGGSTQHTQAQLDYKALLYSL
jgi:hypothetical protein